ncbi:MAG TPA: polysaccharide deacetylase family protein [Kofleriaceae bacterium]|nr:polysaccharide deacetylase family protein [Kofleriaceae bacterium]
MAPVARQVARDAVQRATRGRIVWRGPSDRRRVAITFDDGPNAMTEQYLACLAALGAPATFFVMGYYVEKRPEIVAEYLRGGHQVAGHGYYHKRFTRLRPDQLLDQLARSERAFGPIPHGKWVRPPHGSLGPVDGATMLAAGYTVAMWSFDSKDHDGASADVLVERCAPGRCRPGDVMLFHEGEVTTLAALPRIIEALRADGYELVTMADLLAR